MESETIGLVVHAVGRTGVLHQLTGVIARHEGDISSVDILDNRPDATRTYFEVSIAAGPDRLIEDLRSLPIVRDVEIVKPLQKIYGKRIIIMGGGAQVGQVAIGAVSEADRHNIRGELISVDTIPLVGEQKLADAVRAVARLPRAKALVLAGSLMGGDIETAVREVRAQGLLVVSLNMAGSVPEAADLVVTDPVQAGVMAVMAIAETAKFTVERLKRRVF
jgi:energy-converting hydrogenase B subunit Q